MLPAFTYTDFLHLIPMRFARLVAMVLLVSIAAAQSGPPAITSAQPATIARSAPFTITGNGFGAQQGTSSVLIDAVPSPVSFWSDTVIHAYVLGNAALGPANLQVVTSAGGSNVVPIAIDPIEPGNGRVQWRFRTESFNLDHRAGISSDGSVHVLDGDGLVYALTRDGALKWIFDTGGSGFGSTLDIGPDDTVYVGSNPLGPQLNVVAIRPDGTLNWVFSDDSQETVAGPNVGPDGNIYVVHEFGLNVFSLTPQGALRWSAGQGFDYGEHGSEIVFTADQVHFCDDGNLTAFDFNGGQRWEVPVSSDTEQVAVHADGSVYVEGFSSSAGMSLLRFDAAGSPVWAFPFNPSGPPTNLLTAPDVGPDGVVYIVRNLSQLWAIHPNATQKWMVVDPHVLGQITANASPYCGPIVSPDNSKLLIGGFLDFGQPGIVKAYDTDDGAPLFNVLLPIEQGSNFVPLARPIFAPNSRSAYIGVQPLGGTADYAYLYAIDTLTQQDATTYCTAKVNSLGCTPAMGFAGIPSATAGSGFTVTCDNVRNQKAGLLFYKVNGTQQAIAFQGGTLCVGPSGIKRTAVQSSGGTPLPASDCSGNYSLDMNAFAASSGPPIPDSALQVPGTLVHCQWWGRDPGFPAPNNTTLSDGLEYMVGQ